MSKVLRSSILAVAMLGGSTLVSAANAALMVSSSLFTPQLPVGTTNTNIDLAGVTTPSQSTRTGSGYTLSFAVAANEGVVQGAASGAYAIPVAGISGGNPTYMTGGFGSSVTSSAAASGNYLSTGTGTITLTFTNPQKSLALLWGSIDQGNVISFGNAAGDTLMGSQVQSQASGFVSNGYQGPGGSAYVVAVSDTTFTTVTFSSSTPSFELAGIVASVGTISTVPLPSSAPMFGAALMALGAVGYGMSRKARATLSA